ncbi:MAG: SocA family protein [Treponema sp.]|jgi:hypothetical protein|nr:SocA family protein [Treponema sp.]
MLDKQILRNTILYIIELAGENGIGEVKLNKALVMVDALHKKIYGESLTGATYIKHKYGPVPGREAYALLKHLIETREIEVFEEMISPGIYEKNHYTESRASRDLFTEEEQELISWAVSTVMGMSAQQLSAISHDRYYRNTAMFREINLDDICAFRISEDGELSEDEADRLEKLMEDTADEISQLIHSEKTTAHSAV